MENQITISKDVMEQVFDHCKTDYPYECCGILIGDYDTKIVKTVLAAENIRKDRKDRFEIAPEDLFKGEQVANDLSLDVIGYYHSHPDHPNRPSEYDRERAFAGLSYIIVSIKQGKKTDPKSWVLSDVDQQFKEETINLI